MILEQLLEPAEIYTHREDQQEKGQSDRNSAPRQRDVSAEAPCQHPASARNENKESSEQTDDHGQRKHPAGDELPSGQSEKKEVQRLAKNRVYQAALGAGCIPEECERRPLRHHAGAGGSRNEK